MDQAGEEAQDAARRMATHLVEADREALSGLVTQNLRDFRSSVRAYVQGQFQLRNPEFREQLSRDSLLDKSFNQLSVRLTIILRGSNSNNGRHLLT